MKVKALWITDVNSIESRLTEINDEPGYNEVQVEIKACGICAWDCALFSGKTTPGPFPFMHGHEGIGYVRKTGEGVKDIKTGQLVMCSEDSPQMIQVQNINRKAVAPIYADVSEKEIPLWIGEPASCIVNALGNINLRPATEVALVGAGYMGLLYVQGLMKSLISNLIVFDLDEERLKLAKKFGADEVYLSNSEEAKKIVTSIQKRGGVGMVIECSGAESGLKLANELMATTGILNLFAWHRGTRMIDMTPWHQRGYRVYNTAPNFDRNFQDHLAETEALFRRGVFDQKDLITHVYKSEEAQEIMEIATAKKDGYIKGVITF
ncbi:MAG: zinc-dependent alcohol dehydrogenase [Saccharofermentanales bacterium]